MGGGESSGLPVIDGVHGRKVRRSPSHDRRRGASVPSCQDDYGVTPFRSSSGSTAPAFRARRWVEERIEFRTGM